MYVDKSLVEFIELTGQVVCPWVEIKPMDVTPVVCPPDMTVETLLICQIQIILIKVDHLIRLQEGKVDVTGVDDPLEVKLHLERV